MKKLSCMLFMLLAFYGCKQEVDFDSPANEHIQEYTKQKQECDKIISGNNNNNQVLDKSDETSNQNPQTENKVLQTESIPEDDEDEEDENELHEQAIVEATTAPIKNTSPIQSNNEVEQVTVSESVKEEPSPTDTKDIKTNPSEEKNEKESAGPKSPIQSIVNRESMFDYSPYDIILGDPDSKIQVIQYTSPTCAHCAYYNITIFSYLKKKYIDTKKISYVIREYISNKQDRDAAILCHCAGKERFLQFMNILYSTQSSWAYSSNYLENLINIGKIGGVSEGQYRECLVDTKLLNGLINLTIEVSKNPKVFGTPVFFINGKLHERAYSEKELSKSIDAEIERFQNEKK